jgi:membrane protease YdiL (CAAX protease family)
MAIFSMAAAVIASLAYFSIRFQIGAGDKEKSPAQIISRYLWRKAGGFLILGALPAIFAWLFFDLRSAQAGLSWSGTGLLWPRLAVAAVFFISFNLMISRSREGWAVYPELRLRDWNPAMLAIAAGGWILYLVGYEFLFRGLLLLSCLKAFGLWPALIINLALYSAFHIPKGMKETIAAIPFGAFLCYLVIDSHSIFPAVFVHVLQAVSYEIFCLYRNPEMHFNFS